MSPARRGNDGPDALTIDNNATLADAARAYARHGWAVHPLRGKEPRTPHGFHDATTDPRQIDVWWHRWPDAGVGLATGASGLLVVDVDAYVPGAYDELLDLEHEHGPFPVTAAAVTGSGRGVHFFFTAPPGAGIGCSTSRLGVGLDVKAEGGYVVAPPSAGDVAAYRWSTFGLCWDAVLPEPPAGVVDALRPPVRDEQPTAVRTCTGSARDRLAGLLNTVLTAPEGTRNDVLNWAAFQVGGLVRAGILDERTANDALDLAGIRAGLEPREVAGTVRSGLSAGIRA